MRAGPVAAVLTRASASAAFVYLLYWAPPFLLVRVIPWLPASVDPWFLAFALQAALLLGTVLVFGLPRSSVASVGVSAGGLRAVFWLLSGAALFALLGAVTVISTSDAASVGFTVSNGLRGIARDFPHSGLIGGVIRSAVLGPVFEEFLFRAFVMGFLLRPARPWVALILSTALFATLHQSWVYSALGGLVYGLLYLRYRSVWLCILAHAGNNLLVATGAPILVAYLHELGMLNAVRENLLLLQLSWCVVALACLSMFLVCLVGNGRGKAMLLSRSS